MRVPVIQYVLSNSFVYGLVPCLRLQNIYNKTKHVMLQNMITQIYLSADERKGKDEKGSPPNNQRPDAGVLERAEKHCALCSRAL